jgi:hypothetical protein
MGSEDSRGCLETILAIADGQAPLVMIMFFVKKHSHIADHAVAYARLVTQT